MRTGPVKTVQFKTIQIRTGQVRTGLFMTGQLRTGLFMTGQVMTGQLRNVKSGFKTGLFRTSQVGIICQPATGRLWTSQVGDRSIQVLTAQVQSRWVKSIWNFSNFLLHKVFLLKICLNSIFLYQKFFCTQNFWKDISLDYVYNNLELLTL